jgi:hypothetical protein
METSQGTVRSSGHRPVRHRLGSVPHGSTFLATEVVSAYRGACADGRPITVLPMKARLITYLLRLAGISAVIMALSADAFAQQFVVDDAEIADRGACQLEAWHGQTGSWILPACQFIPNLEITAGIGFVDEDGDTRDFEYVVQGKYIFRELQPNDFAIGLVAGFGFDPLSQVTGERVHGYFAYVPVSVSIFDDRAFLHGNLGWVYHDDDHHDDDDGHHHAPDVEGHHAVTWGLRTDIWIAPRLALIAEIFGEDRLYPEFQLGGRVVLIPDRLELDLSWAGHTQSDMDGAGWAVGLAWTPPPFR